MTVVEVSPEVAREAAIRAARVYIAGATAEYRQWIEDGAHKSGRVDPIEATDVAYECAHERLPHDPCPSPDGVWPHPHPCACWHETNGHTPLPTPDLIEALKSKEIPVQTTEPPRDVTDVEREKIEAPFGRKANGTPRKRPTPSPEQMAAAAAGRARAKKARDAAKVAPLAIAGTSAVAGTSGTPSIAVVQSPLIARLVAELDAEIEQLTNARSRLLGVE